jgi:pimeloyl-ACP methyl ester carboxylesterase
VSYDRAGMGGSDPAPGPRAFAEMASDLGALLAAARVPGPYVLVGQSLGGLVVRVYAERFPADVVGVVLVDAPHPDYPRRALALLPPEAEGECAEIGESRRFFEQVVAGSDDPLEPEGVRMGAGLRQVPGAASLGELPLVVVSAGKRAEFSADFPAALAARIAALVQECQVELAGLSRQGRQVVAGSSGHMVQMEEPEVVVEAVRAVVEAARAAPLGQLRRG